MKAQIRNVILLSICLPLLPLLTGCDAGASVAAKDGTAESKAEKTADQKTADKNTDDKVSAPKAAVVAQTAEDPVLDNSGLNDTGKAIAKLFDDAKTCAFDMDSQIRGCKPYVEFRALQKATSPMTKAFADQRDRVVLTRLKSKEPTVRALSYNLCRGLYRGQPESRAAIEAALLAESDVVALLVGLRALRQDLGANPSLAPVFEKHAANPVKEVAETAQKALDEAALAHARSAAP